MGCTKVSSGCANCYASENMAIKLRRGGRVNWGPGQPRQRTKWTDPVALERKAIQEDRVITVFPSLCDVFDADGAQLATLDHWRDDLFDLIESTPHLAWLLLTKRPDVALQPHWAERIERLGRNVWIGVSIEDQPNADRRVPQLLKIPAKNRFISAEPLLGPIDLTPWLHGLDWIIVGGESGKNARPMQLEWAEAIRAACEKQERTKFYFKQMGGRDKAKGGALLAGRRIQQTPVFTAAA